MATILLVDDSNLSRRLLRRILEPVGHNILEASDGMLAIERYFVDRPDLVMLDMNMAEMHGLDVLQQLRSLDPGARVVVATADVQSTTQALAFEAGASGFVPKPFLEKHVREVVDRVLTGGVA